MPISVPLTGLTPNTTYQAEVVATNADGTTSSQNLSFTTPSSPSAAPTLTGLDESARSWYLGTAAARISASRHPVGTMFSFTLNETAIVTFTFSQTVAGRKVSGHCVKPGKSNRHKRRCERVGNRATLSFTGHPGVNHVYFDGVIAHRSNLKPRPVR